MSITDYQYWPVDNGINMNYKTNYIYPAVNNLWGIQTSINTIYPGQPTQIPINDIYDCVSVEVARNCVIESRNNLEESILRVNNPSLNELWNEYQVMLALVKETNDHIE
jgi:hypothetical protein